MTTSSDTKTVIIVDDHILFARSLQALIKDLGNYEVLTILKNGKELTKYFSNKRKKPDVVLMDIKMPIMDGIQTMKWLKENEPNQKVLALTMEDDEEIIIRMLRAGARGYLLKDIHPDNFKHALTRVIEEGFYYTPQIANAIRESNPLTEKIRMEDSLSDRELEFLKHACSEMTYKEIASLMNVSPKTIEGYRESISKKLQIKTRIGIVMYCIRNKMVEF